MIGFLRFLGLANAAVWFGAAIFFTCAAAPGIFSEEMRVTLGVGPPAFKFFAGGIALVMIKRYFILQHICGALALVHLLAERLYLGRKTGRFVVGVVVGMFILGLLGGFWLQPKMKALRQAMYAAPTAQQQEQPHHSFAVWHGVAMTANLAVIGGLVVLLVRVSRPPDSRHYGTVYQIP